MALRGSVTTTTSHNRSVTLNWSATQDITNNKSTISWEVVGSGSASGYVVVSELKVTINGSQVYYRNSDSRTNCYSGTKLASGTTTITHNADGSKSFSAAVSAGIYEHSINCSGSQSFTLDTIPRASIVRATTANVGSNSTITINRASSSFTHTLTYSFGSLSDTIVSKTTSTSVSFSIPTTFYAQMTTVKSMTGTITCDTYNGNTKIGTSSCTFTVSVPSSSAPSITATAVVNDSLSREFTGVSDKIIKGYSEVCCDLSATVKNSATLKSLTIKNGSHSYSPSLGSAQTSISVILQKVANKEFEFTAVDSRGMSTTQKITLNMIESYAKPTVTVSNGKMTAAGALTAKISGTFFNSSFGSKSNFILLYYRVNSGSWQLVTPSKSGNTFTYNLSLNGDYTQTYSIQAKVTDALNTVTSSSISVSCYPTFDWSKSDFNFNVPVTLNNKKITSTRDDLAFEHSYNDRSVFFGIGSGGSNRGIYDREGGINDWLIRLNSNNYIYLKGSGLMYENLVGNTTRMIAVPSTTTFNIGTAAVFSGYITSSSKAIKFFIPLSIPIDSSCSSVSVTGKVVIRGVNGYVGGTTTASGTYDLGSPSGFTVSAYIERFAGVLVTMTFTTAPANVTNNTPVSISTNDSGCNIKLTFS